MSTRIRSASRQWPVLLLYHGAWLSTITHGVRLRSMRERSSASQARWREPSPVAA